MTNTQSENIQSIIFGPVISRRFGVSLGVDLSPSGKQCNFDCLYCELKGAKAIGYMSDILSLDKAKEDIKNGLETHKNIDVITFTANGEPSMYPFLYELITYTKKLLRDTNSKIKTLILSNGSLFGIKGVKIALNEFDIVKFSLDSINPRNFKRVDRAHKGIELEAIKQGIREFSQTYQGTLVCETLLVKNVNDSMEDIKSLAEFLKTMRVDRVDIGTIDRPPAYRVEGVSFEYLESIAPIFAPLYVSLPKRKDAIKIQNLNQNELLNTLQKRPLSVEEVNLSVESNVLENLISTQKIQKVLAGSVEFYKLS